MMPLRMSTFDNLTDESQGTQGIIISLACVSSETHNLQRVFRPPPGGGVVPFIGYIGMCRAKGYGFLAVLVGNTVSFRPFWSEIGYGLCTLVLNWVCLLEELATSSLFDDKTISHLMFTPTTVYVPQQPVQAPGSRASVLKFYLQHYIPNWITWYL